MSEMMQKNPKLNMVTSVKKFLETSKSKALKDMLNLDIYASNVYTLGYEKDSWSNLDYTSKIITVNDMKG